MSDTEAKARQLAELLYRTDVLGGEPWEKAAFRAGEWAPNFTAQRYFAMAKAALKFVEQYNG